MRNRFHSSPSSRYPFEMNTTIELTGYEYCSFNFLFFFFCFSLSFLSSKFFVCLCGVCIIPHGLVREFSMYQWHWKIIQYKVINCIRFERKNEIYFLANRATEKKKEENPLSIQHPHEKEMKMEKNEEQKLPSLNEAN